MCHSGSIPCNSLAPILLQVLQSQGVILEEDKRQSLGVREKDGTSEEGVTGLRRDGERSPTLSLRDFHTEVPMIAPPFLERITQWPPGNRPLREQTLGPRR